MIAPLLLSQRHLTSYGFYKSYQSSTAISSDEGSVVAWAGWKNRPKTLFHISGDPEDGKGCNRVYSGERLVLPGFTEKKHTEYVFNVDTAKDLSGKAKYNELTAPDNWMKRRNLVAERVQGVSPGLRSLWISWSVERLMSGLMIINFPTTRNLRCFEDSVDPNYAAFVLRDGDKVLAARVLQLSPANGVAFDLAFIGDREEPYAFRALRNYTTTWLRENGIHTINLGETTGKGLTAFKDALGADTALSWQYDRIVPLECEPVIRPKKASSGPRQVPVKDYLRAKFVESDTHSMESLMEPGYSLSGVMGAITELKDAKTAGGAILLLTFVREPAGVVVKGVFPSKPPPMLIF